MNLYFRLIRVVLQAWLGKHENPMEPTQVTFRVWPFDLDLNIHMNNARYLSWMDLGRVYHMGVTGLYRKSIQRKWMPVVGHIDIKFIKPLPPFAKVTLRTEIHGHDEKYFDIRQTFFYQDHPMAIAHVKGIFVSKKEGKIHPQAVIDALKLEK